MKVLDPGHYYELANLDGTTPDRYLQFVKREGPGYSGNVGHNPGTTIQEVLRACCERLRYVGVQQPSRYTNGALGHIKDALLLLEQRAAERHGRNPEGITLNMAEFGACCPKCNHVGCEGGCH